MLTSNLLSVKKFIINILDLFGQQNKYKVTVIFYGDQVEVIRGKGNYDAPYQKTDQ